MGLSTQNNYRSNLHESLLEARAKFTFRGPGDNPHDACSCTDAFDSVLTSSTISPSRESAGFDLAFHVISFLQSSFNKSIG